MSDSNNIDLPVFPEGYDIQTEHLTLTAPSEPDAEYLFPMMSDPRLTEFLAWEPHDSIQATKELLCSLGNAQRNGTGFHWTVKKNQLPVGIVSLIDVRRRHRSWILNRGELAYWIGLPHQNQGIACEAAASVMCFGFEKLGFNKLVVYHAVENSPSEKTVNKLNFRFVGVEREAFFKSNKWYDLKQYEVLRNEFNIQAV